MDLWMQASKDSLVKWNLIADNKKTKLLILTQKFESWFKFIGPFPEKKHKNFGVDMGKLMLGN